MMHKKKRRRFSDFLASSDEDEYQTKSELLQIELRKQKARTARLEKLKMLRSPEYKAKIAKQYAAILEEENSESARSERKKQRLRGLKEFTYDEELTGDSTGTRKKSGRRKSKGFRFDDVTPPKSDKKSRNHVTSLYDLNFDSLKNVGNSAKSIEKSGRKRKRRYKKSDSIKYNKKRQKEKKFEFDYQLNGKGESGSKRSNRFKGLGLFFLVFLGFLNEFFICRGL